jgi:hypothetical protein
MMMANRRAGWSSSIMPSIKAKWAITRLRESTEMSYLAPSAERLVSSPSRKRPSVGKEMPQANAIHDDLRKDMHYYRDLFIDIMWLMWCLNTVGFAILVVALKIGYLNY